MSQIQNKNALITGGASGIGKLMGLALLQRGLGTLVIWDINEKMLNETKQEFTDLGFQVKAYTLDIMDTEAIIATKSKVNQEVGKIDILINNAGIIIGKNFHDHTHAEIDRTMLINTSAMMHITREFLPAMISTNEGHIINIASAAGMVSNPKMSVYVASKFAVLGWSDSLRLELKISRSAIKVTTVTPFYINTGMFDGVRSSIIPILNPQVATRKIIKGILADKIYVRMPGIVYLVPLLKGILPASWFDIIVGKWFGIHHSMDAFTGRK